MTIVQATSYEEMPVKALSPPQKSNQTGSVHGVLATVSKTEMRARRPSLCHHSYKLHNGLPRTVHSVQCVPHCIMIYTYNGVNA